MLGKDIRRLLVVRFVVDSWKLVEELDEIIGFIFIIGWVVTILF
jgi:hypothetical protein